MILVGDVHGKSSQYHSILDAYAFTGETESVQLGDMGFDYEHLSRLDPEKHRFIPGNHDNYAALPKHSLGDFGEYKKFFFVRGGESIDVRRRTLGIDFFHEEQLNWSQANEALNMWKDSKKRVILSHECPASICEHIHERLFSPSFTAKLLDAMLEANRPKFWFFGHHHKSFDKTIDGTRFICLAELETKVIL